MRKTTSKIDTGESSPKPTGHRVRELRGWQLAVVWLITALFRLWSTTFRMRPDEETLRLLEQLPDSASIVCLWHNQLFAAPRFYQRCIRGRQLAALISPSGDGAWLAAVMRRIGIQPVRGSSHKRGMQALYELKQKHRTGCDLAITPDGSKGPIYKMKAGAAHLALKSNSPAVLLALHTQYNILLPTWDRFKIPLPFSKVDVKMRIIRDLEARSGGDVEQARLYLEKSLNELSKVA